MILKEHLSNEQGFSDLLNYAHFIENGIIINKDGAFLVTYIPIAIVDARIAEINREMW